MRFDKAKKSAIIQYILEKINEGIPSVARMVSEAFDINTNTVHSYITELLNNGVIQRVRRGSYRLTTARSDYDFDRKRGELKDEQEIYDTMLRRHFVQLPGNVQGIWDYILGEMINNVIDHSGASTLHITVKQNRLNTAVFVMDNGIGIFKKIASHFNFPSTEEAICELFKGKLTTDPANHSGEGIFFSSKLADKFRIMSDGRIFSNDKYGDDFLLDVPFDGPGTCVLVELSNTSNKLPADIFNQYSNVDGGFTRTRIPLRSIFDSSPVSRSQAKRICQRLELFHEIILDFDGLDWMGQGFAHQLFVVFPSQHPGISLTPVNMSQSVLNMYRHVTSCDFVPHNRNS